LAYSGIIGSLAGTGLRQTFIELWNSSSDLSNILGKGIKTFDEFIDALVRVQEEGTSVDKVLEAVPTRAKTMFSVLLSGAEDIRTFAGELDNANGSIDEMANIQLETLAFQLERVSASWGAWVLSMQENGGWLKSFFKGMADTFEGMARATDPAAFTLIDASRAAKEFLDSISERGAAAKMEKFGEKIGELNDKIAEETVLLNRLKQLQKDGTITSVGEDEIKRINRTLEGYNEQLRIIINAERDFAAEGGASVKIEKLLRIFEELEASGVGSIEAINEAFKIVSGELGDDLVAAFEAGEEAGFDSVGRILELVRAFYNERKKLLIDNQALQEEIDKKALENFIKQQRALLALQQKLELERNENKIQSELDREIEILRINTKYARLNYELDLQSGELSQAQADIVNKLLLESEETFRREKQELIKEYDDKELAEARKKFDELWKLEKARHETSMQLLKNTATTKTELEKINAEISKKGIEFEIRQQRALITFLERAGASKTEIALAREELARLNAELAAPDVSKDVERNIQTIVNAYKQLASEIIDSIQLIVDSQVSATERIVDDLNTRVAETQRELEIEAGFYRDGYANNVTLKKKELADLKEARDKAIKDREAAIRKQQAIEAVAQAINLGSAVAKTINTYASIPFVGVALALAAVGSFLGLFFAAQNKIKSATQYGEGGKVDGKSHAQGGVPAELEGGEYVIKKSAYAKHAGLIHAINSDTLPTLNQSVLNSTSFEKKDGDVILEAEVWNRIESLLADNLKGERVVIQGNKKIITSGIKKRIINNV